MDFFKNFFYIPDKFDKINETNNKEEINEIDDIEEINETNEIDDIEEINETNEIDNEIDEIDDKIDEIDDEIDDNEMEIEEIDGIEKILDKDNSSILDVDAMLRMSKFTIKPNDLIKRCKYILQNKIGLNEESDLADNFQFIFPVVGPLSKKEYLSTLRKFNLEKMFPNIDKGIYYNFYVDPYENNRVWFTARMRCCHTGSNSFGSATNINVDCPPQVNSLSFNDHGKVIKYTGGYVTDRTIGNTGGLGGIFGILYAIGRPLPFPEARPYRKSWQFRTFSFFGM